MARYDDLSMDDPPNTDSNAWFKVAGWNADQGSREFRQRYFGESSHLNTAFARVRDTLEQTGLADSAIVLFTSDHGEMAGCHGLFGKSYMYDESVCVPLLVRVPGGPARTVDLFSTVLDLAGADAPPDAQGCLLVPALRGEDNDIRDLFVQDTSECLIRVDLKLITPRDSDEIDQCFDEANDPYEMNNLASTLDQRTTERPLAAIDHWRNRTRLSMSVD